MCKKICQRVLAEVWKSFLRKSVRWPRTVCEVSKQACEGVCEKLCEKGYEREGARNGLRRGVWERVWERVWVHM